MQKVLELLEPQMEDIVLDVGCGPGAQLATLLRRIKFGFGVDPAELMIRRAEQSATSCPNLGFYVGTAEVIPQELHRTGINKIGWQHCNMLSFKHKRG